MDENQDGYVDFEEMKRAIMEDASKMFVFFGSGDVWRAGGGRSQNLSSQFPSSLTFQCSKYLEPWNAMDTVGTIDARFQSSAVQETVHIGASPGNPLDSVEFPD